MKPRSPFDVRRLPFHIRMGFQYGIPICCIIHFCWDNMLRRAAGMTRWKQISNDRNCHDWVPCGVLHVGGSAYSCPERVTRILWFELSTLSFTRQAAKLRSTASCGSQAYREADTEAMEQAIANGRVERLWWGE